MEGKRREEEALRL